MARKSHKWVVKHDKLGLSKTVSAPTLLEIKVKADEQKRIWDRMWRAEEMTAEAIEAIEGIQQILTYGLNQKLQFHWDELRSFEDFSEKQPEVSFIDNLFQSSLNKKEKKIAEWKQQKQDFERRKENRNGLIDILEKSYEEGEGYAIVKWVEHTLAKSLYPHRLQFYLELDYVPESRHLLVNWTFPSPDALPRLKEVRYIKTRDELQKKYLPDTIIKKLFDEILYQTTLRTIHEIFATDPLEHIDIVTFNGYVDSIDKRTGKGILPCVLTVSTSKEAFQELELERIDPKECFKYLKGISSSKLHELAAVAPLAQINRTDSRFVEAYDVTASIDSTTNIAAMDWEDFEHLIRELFEQEFASEEAEVRVTQASRDKGVDAVIFDPDPIKGGKIVVQAKRYTNVVGVSAVRDLYGTVMNEGAMKGILVTTSSYGPDAHEFAKDKPLTLLSGGNLLHMLEKHGHKAIIDIAEAKKRLSE